MRKSVRPSFDEIRPIVRLLADVVERRDDVASRDAHLSLELCRIFAARECSIVRFADWGPVGEPKLVGAMGGGWPDPKIAPLLLEFNQSHSPRADPVLDEFSKLGGEVQVQRISEFVGMERMYRSAVYDIVGRVVSVGDGLVGRFNLQEPGRVVGILLHRTRSDSLFGERQRSLYQFLIEELHHFSQRGLIAQEAAPPLIPRMPRRERQILELLLAGEGWKQIARKLQLSRHTVAGYGKSLFKRLDVHTRSELSARFTRQDVFPPQPPP